MKSKKRSWHMYIPVWNIIYYLTVIAPREYRQTIKQLEEKERITTELIKQSEEFRSTLPARRDAIRKIAETNPDEAQRLYKELDIEIVRFVQRLLS